jgi:propanol-preferring alcohol dehydrogenase
MKAMILDEQPGQLELRDVPEPEPEANQVKLRVQRCGICRTDLHIIDGELDDPNLPLIPGHQVVGEVVETGASVESLSEGETVGIPWLGWTCGECEFCRRGKENLCDRAKFSGYDIDGGFAEYAVADSRFAFPIAADYPATQAAPLLCAGLIGYRSWQKIGEHVERVGFYGFGSAAHILVQVADYEDKDVYAFTKPGDTEGQAFAKKLGAVWAGGSKTQPPETLDAAIIFAPVGPLVVEALKATRKGGRVICAGIHMSPIPSFEYDKLWGERQIHSIANLTRTDGVEFLELAPEIPVETEVTPFRLEKANEALEALREGRFDGSGVLVVGE